MCRCDDRTNMLRLNVSKTSYRSRSRRRRGNGNHINMISLKGICLFMVIISSCSLYANGKNVNNLKVTDLPNEVKANPYEVRKTRGTSDNEYYDDEFVMEDMSLVQQDQPSFMRQPFDRLYGQMQREPPAQEKFEQKRRTGNGQLPNVQFTREVQIKQGRLKGLVRAMHPQTGLKNVRQYLGIPYAAAPIGNGRFMPPGAPPPWNGLKMAVELSPVCPQNLPSLNNSQQHLTTGRYNHLKRLMRYLQNESEDCLFLNLYVPEWSGIGPRPIYPVIVFVHGESYEWNSGNAYDGSILSSYGQVIVVTLNYRLGILGFLQPGTTGHTANNFGLLDQIAALQWVKDNIAAFGGDVGSVTLMGTGTGSACINLLMLSPTCEGLFHRAILMSGSAMSDWAISNHPQQSTMQVLRSLDCPMRDDNDEMLTCLQKKRYQDILKSSVHVSSPEFTTTFGPVVDNFIVPNDPQKMMQHGRFKRYDLLFGVTETESYNRINAIEIKQGLSDHERDDYLRFYMQNQFDRVADVAMDLALNTYTSNICTNPRKPTREENRDIVLEILSDARYVAPLIQTGNYHSKLNPLTYMYLFSHISKAGDYPNLSQSISGEELPYVFGAPLASARPFPTSYTPQERLLSEEIMVYWTNFAKTGNPKAPGRDHFLNMDPSNWEQYDIDWPPFQVNNSSYLNIGIPPVVSRNYRQQYMNFWNSLLSEQLNVDAKPVQVPTERNGLESTSFVKPLIPHVNYYLDKSTENPIRQLQYLLHHTGLNRSDMYATQSTVETPQQTVFDTVLASPENTFVLGDNKIIVKADSTLNVLIAMVIIFLVINVIIISIYLVRRNYFKKNLKQKLDILSLDGTTDDDLKRSNKFNDGDESFILDIVRRKNEYVPVKRYHSPINGFLLTRHYSTSTVDTHTKVSDWISHEVNRQSPHLRSKSPSFSFGTTNQFFGKKTDDNNSADSGAHGERQPIELMKSKSFELDRKTEIVCQELNDRGPMFDRVIASNVNNSPEISACVLQIDHRHTNSDPVGTMKTAFAQNPNEKVTSFIEDVDMNVTSRDECDGASHFPLTPEETLRIYQMRNYPKVLPKYPNVSSEYVSTSSFKRRSMPSYQHMLNTYAKYPPVPPPRTSSTLDRMAMMRLSDGNRSDPLPLVPVMAQPIPEAVEEPETIAIAALHVGPLLPGSKENLYSTVNRKKYNLDNKQPCIIAAAQIETPSEPIVQSPSTECTKEPNKLDTANSQPKSIMKRPFIRQNMLDGNTTTTPASALPTTSKIPILSRLSASGKSSSSSSSNSDNKSSDPSTDDSAKDLIAELDRSAASITSSVETCSSAETIKQIF
ncbi:uncharacterized protein LOC129576332 [Sitodiplosis mosellana]|uniref:uncharacterized protein LOC129576332 n=1 Tax=Sitodiplosis mosellana TaxID=263140 RepID=UPI002443766B|nr:uncharacterized protein LOC129576332 [Sitodiplosis mosellana]